MKGARRSFFHLDGKLQIIPRTARAKGEPFRSFFLPLLFLALPQ